MNRRHFLQTAANCAAIAALPGLPLAVGGRGERALAVSLDDESVIQGTLLKASGML